MRTSPRVPLTPRPERRDSLLPASLLVALLLAGTTGCGQHATRATSPDSGTSAPLLPPTLGGTQLPGLSPDLTRGGATYPLAVGNAWDYDIHERVVTTTPSGETFVYEDHRPFRSSITGTGQVFERDYFFQTEYDPRFEPPIGPTFALRQDGTGLYHQDLFLLFGDSARRPGDGGASHMSRPSGEALGSSVRAALADSPHRAAFERAALELTTRLESMRLNAANLPEVPGGAASGELTMLDYPLHAGAHWVVRASPRFERTVLRREHLELPVGSVSAWRLRGQSELYGPDDRVWFWYGDDGLVRSLVHARLHVRDDLGRIIGEVFGTWDQKLVSFSTGFGPIEGARTVAAQRKAR